MAFIDIYSSQPLDYARGNLEDDLDEFLNGYGETCGGGGGERGWNIDLEINDDEDLGEWVQAVVTFLRGLKVPPDTYLKTENARYSVYEGT